MELLSYVPAFILDYRWDSKEHKIIVQNCITPPQETSKGKTSIKLAGMNLSI